MQLSSKLRPRWYLGCAAALGPWLLGANAASAQYPPRLMVRLDARGFQTSMAQQAFFQQREEDLSRGAYAAPAETMVLEPRYVTLIGPDGRARVFQIEGPITVVPMRQTVVHFGANNTEGPVVMVPVRQPNIHFGANH